MDKILNVFSQDVLKQEILNSFKELPELKDYFVNGTNPVLELFSSQIAAILSKKLFYLNQLKNENYIQFAKNPENKYYLAKSFGYRINRYSCPKISMTYMDLEAGSNPRSLPLKYGDVIGKYGDMDIIYIGEDRIVERGDVVTCAIGKSKSMTDNFKFEDGNSLIKLRIVPEELKSVDNDEIRFYVNGNLIELSKDLEDFIIKDRAVDYSDSNTISEIYVFEYESLYGVRVTPEDIYKVKWIETNGRVDKLDTSKIQSLINGQFKFKEVLSLGADCDSLEKLSWLPIFYYRTMRRAVTDDDYRYILLNYPLFKDISIYSKDVNNKYIFYIHSQTNDYEIKKLTDYESQQVSEYINRYKMSGIQLYFIPGKPVDLVFKVTISLYDPSKITFMQEKVKELLRNYTLKFIEKVSIGDIIAEISQIKDEEGNNLVKYIYPADGLKDTYELEKYEYLVLKDENFNIEFM